LSAVGSANVQRDLKRPNFFLEIFFPAGKLV